MISVRIVTPAEAADLAHLNWLFNDVETPPEVLVRRLADPQQVETALLAWVDGQAAGFAGLRVTPGLFYAEPHAELTELYVLEEYRRQGVARALIAYAEDLARGRGATGLMVLTGADNEAALALYRALGFEDYDLALGKDL